jgi:hypothetical protein
MTDEVRIINTEEAANVDPELEPAGWKREEQLAERTDKLEQAAEEASEEREMGAVDPAKIRPDWEILQHMDELDVSDAVPGYRYMWVYEGLNGQMIVKKSRLGWVVVQGDNPECISLKDARNYRQIGDTILMRIPEDRFEKLEQAQEYRRLMQQKGIEGALREMGDKYRSKGFIVHEDASQTTQGRSGSSLMDTMAKRSHGTGARTTATAGVNSMLRSGTVPGMPPPGKAGG